LWLLQANGSANKQQQQQQQRSSSRKKTFLIIKRFVQGEGECQCGNAKQEQKSGIPNEVLELQGFFVTLSRRVIESSSHIFAIQSSALWRPVVHAFWRVFTRYGWGQGQVGREGSASLTPAHAPQTRFDAARRRCRRISGVTASIWHSLGVCAQTAKCHPTLQLF
jgi:hypothetical protein